MHCLLMFYQNSTITSPRDLYKMFAKPRSILKSSMPLATPCVRKECGNGFNENKNPKLVHDVMQYDQVSLRYS